MVNFCVKTEGTSKVRTLNIKIRDELIFLNVLVIVLIVAIAIFPSNAVRIVLGLPFLLFFPGYALMAALFPRRTGMDTVERIVLSFGISIVVVPLIGFVLNYTPWGIRLEPVLYSVGSFILIVSITAWLRRRRLPEQERFSIQLQLKAPSWGRHTPDRVLSVILIVVILGALGTLGYVIAKPKEAERFTEFYILGLEGRAVEYPREVKVGEDTKIIVVITNHEREVVSYRVEVKIAGIKNNEVGPMLLANEEKWEEILSFVPDKVGDNVKVEFFLYKNEESEPFLKPLHLWINVID